MKAFEYIILDVLDDRDDPKSQNILKELENIDDEADEHDLPFIKIDDDQARIPRRLKSH